MLTIPCCWAKSCIVFLNHYSELNIKLFNMGCEWRFIYMFQWKILPCSISKYRRYYNGYHDSLDFEICKKNLKKSHYGDVIMDAIASQITSLAIVYSIVYSDADQRKHQSSASLAFVRGIHRGPVNSPHKWPVTRKMFPFDDVIMYRSTVRYSPRKYAFIHCQNTSNRLVLKQ